MEIFNKEEIYDNELSPLVRQIIDICNEHQIPMIASFTFENCQDRGAGRCTTFLNGFEERQDEAIKKAALVIKNGGHETLAIAIVKPAGPQG